METLKNLEIGKSAVISKVGGTGALRQHFLDMGMIPGVKVTMMKHAPMGDPHRGKPSGIQPFVHAVHCGNFGSPPRARTRMGDRRRALAVRACMDYGIRCAFYRTISASCDNLIKKYRD